MLIKSLFLRLQNSLRESFACPKPCSKRFRNCAWWVEKWLEPYFLWKKWGSRAPLMPRERHNVRYIITLRWSDPLNHMNAPNSRARFSNPARSRRPHRPPAPPDPRPHWRARTPSRPSLRPDLKRVAPEGYLPLRRCVRHRRKNPPPRLTSPRFPTLVRSDHQTPPSPKWPSDP